MLVGDLEYSLLRLDAPTVLFISILRRPCRKGDRIYFVHEDEVVYRGVSLWKILGFGTFVEECPAQEADLEAFAAIPGLSQVQTVESMSRAIKACPDGTFYLLEAIVVFPEGDQPAMCSKYGA
eukprot:743305-Alexandrium_andersonii.AAC.1